MRTYYNDRHVKVTSEYVAIGDHRYPVGELQEISTTRGPVHRMVVRTLSGGISLVAMAIVMSAVMPVAMTAAIGLSGLVGVGSAFVLSRTHPREWTLWANFRGMELALIRTRDSIEVGKLNRALRKARENWSAGFPVMSN
jgi:hypothetical protein